MTTVRYASSFAVSQQELFDFHRDGRNLARISPPFPRIEIEEEPGWSEAGDIQRVVMRAGPFTSRWDARVVRVTSPKLVEDVQERGPFRSWRHQHRVIAEGTGSRLEDRVAFRLLPTPVGAFMEWVFVRPALVLMFAYRHRRTRELLGRGVR